MEFKEIVFIIGAAVSVPAGILLARTSRFFLDFMFAALIFSTCMPDWLDINFLSREMYRGTSRGIGVSYVDFLSVILLVAPLLAAPHERTRWRWPASLTGILAFSAWGCLSVILNDPMLFGTFELVKFFRGLLLFLAVAMYVRGPREIRVLVIALCALVFYQTGWCIVQRYVWGMYRLRGSFAHPNQLSAYMNFLAPMLVALAMSEQHKGLARLSGLCAAMAGLCVIFSISRTGFVVFCASTGIALLISLITRLTPMKLAATLLALVAALGVFVKAWDTLSARYGQTTLEDEWEGDSGRGMYFRLGKLVLRDNFLFGLGLNNWSYIVTDRYYPELGLPNAPYGDTDCNIRGFTDMERVHMIAPPAHNLGVLTAGEMGAPGLLLLAGLWARWFHMSARFLRRGPSSLSNQFGAGVFFALWAAVACNMTEYSFRDTPHMYMTYAITGALAAIYANSQTQRRH